ncbi:MAG: hypothetical protein PUJ51_13440 [Clostridiales bacterium]|uniref:hypothetical protein n=1 Tax=Terrisporobacter sp. TaxID=1965305 RepID=UPI002A58B44E|nr:hypothetical protein [Terrisporobacter sp.]MCI6458652.1 hypothetical protein [Clostridium sp.]MDD7755489.1 hypothetical protein [Clostridiales bacterium]MDY4137220.1 hypothetical protein [Terrisporobacter sp.]MDY4736173.1 hypothetical protein [Terrisporobacter sp.]
MVNLKNVRIRKFMNKSDINILISDYIELIDNVYLGNNYPHNWKCKCGEIINNRQWSNIRFRNDIKCDKCVKQKIINRYKSEVEKVSGYQFINAYFVGDKLPNGKIVKRYPIIEIKHEYCNSIYTIDASSFINDKHRCNNCCGSYENSLAYYIEVILGKSLDTYLDLNKCKYNPYFLGKHSNKKIWAFCLINSYHGSSSIRCADFVKGIKRNSGCRYCGNNDTHKLDSIGHKFPNLANMIIGDVDIFSLGIQSNKKYYLKCTDCGHISKHKVQICNLINQGYHCKVCGDGCSIPEKFMYNILLELGIDFYNRKSFKWSNKKEYDFYIPSLNILIETHGAQHYSDRNSFKSTTLKEQQKNDNYKYILATKNIPKENYYVIDCRVSEFDFLKNNIINTLNNILDFSNIDWNLAWKNSQKSFAKKSWDLWNSGSKNSMIIANKLKLSRTTVIQYLKRGTRLKLCDYNPKEEMRKSALSNACNNKKIKCIFSNGDIKYFNSISDLKKSLNISRHVYSKIMNNGGIIDISIFNHKRCKENLEKINGTKIEFI